MHTRLSIDKNSTCQQNSSESNTDQHRGVMRSLHHTLKSMARILYTIVMTDLGGATISGSGSDGLLCCVIHVYMYHHFHDVFLNDV